MARKIKPNRTLQYAGHEQIVLGGKKLGAHKISTARMEIWVSAKRQLQRALWDGRKSVELTDEKTARAALGK